MTKNSVNILSDYAGKSVLVTGGLGMIGSFVATEASKLGASVTILDNLLPEHGGNQLNIKGFEDNIKVVIGDIRDQELLSELVKDKDIIVHAAAHVSYTDSMKNPFIDLDINARGHLNLLEACRYQNSDAKIIYTSSRMKYGSVAKVPVKENHETNPLMIYGAHKLLGEKYQEIYYHNYGIKYTNVVVPNPYGPRQQMMHAKYGLINWFVRMAMESGEITIFGDGSQIRDYIFVEDITSAILLCGIHDEATGKTINLGNGEGTSFKTMVETILRIVGSGSYKHVDWPEDYFNIETGDYIADITMAASLGYKPNFGFEQGIQNTFDFYKDRKSDYW